MGAGAPGAAPWRSGPPRPPAPPCGGRRGILWYAGPMPAPGRGPARSRCAGVPGRVRGGAPGLPVPVSPGGGPCCGGLGPRPALRRGPGVAWPFGAGSRPSPAARRPPRGRPAAAGRVSGARRTRLAAPCGHGGGGRGPRSPGSAGFLRSPLRLCARGPRPVRRSPGPPSRALPGGPASPWAAAGSSRRRGAAALRAARMRPAPAAFGGAAHLVALRCVKIRFLVHRHRSTPSA